MPFRIARIVSGGQTGVDRAAWDAALALGLAIGGFVPKGRRAEDGPVPARYGPLPETASADPSARTRRNAETADATLILARGEPAGGTALTRTIAAGLGKPWLVVDISALGPEAAATRIRDWLGETEATILNVAGPRESEDTGIYDAARGVLEAVLGQNRS